MRKLYFFFCLTILVSCAKISEKKSVAMERTDFFKDEKELYQTIQTALDTHSLGEKLQTIQSISYIDSRKKSFAFVFYTSDKGSSNIAIKKDYTGGGEEALISTIKCDGAYCTCKVKTIIDDQGDVNVDCSCTSCTMLINN
jgi:hypothetical protein